MVAISIVFSMLLSCAPHRVETMPPKMEPGPAAPTQVKASKRSVPEAGEKLIYTRPAKMPCWVDARDCAPKAGYVNVVGMSAYYAIEQDARRDAELETTTRIVQQIQEDVLMRLQDHMKENRDARAIESSVLTEVTRKAARVFQSSVTIAGLEPTEYYTEKWQRNGRPAWKVYTLARMKEDTYRSFMAQFLPKVKDAVAASDMPAELKEVTVRSVEYMKKQLDRDF